MKHILLLATVLSLSGCGPDMYPENTHAYLAPACEPVVILGVAYATETERESDTSYYIRHENGEEEYVPGSVVNFACVASNPHNH